MTGKTNIDMVAIVCERLKTSPIGDLLSEDDLREITKQALQKVFFQEQIIHDQYHRETSRRPPLINEVVREVMREEVKKATQVWFAENAEQIALQWKAVFESGISKAAQEILDSQMRLQIGVVLKPFIESMNQERQKLGLPYIFVPTM